MDGWTLVAYSAFGVSAAAALMQFGNRLLQANPRTLVNAGRWSIIGLGVAAVGALAWLALNGRWTLSLMMASFVLPVFVQGAPRWRSIIGAGPGLGHLPGLRHLWLRGMSVGGLRNGARGFDPRLVEQSLAVLSAYLQQAANRGGIGRDGMSAAEARDILGLGADAGPEQIQAAHRRLRQRVDPKFGGTPYLAAKVDEARDVLAGRR